MSPYAKLIFRGIAQTGERAAWDREAAGAVPATPTNGAGHHQKLSYLFSSWYEVRDMGRQPNQAEAMDFDVSFFNFEEL